MKNKKAVVLLSGGLDSATVLYLVLRRGYDASCIVFSYGQRHKKEISYAMALAKEAGVPCCVIRFSLPWKGSSLLDKTIDIPKRRGLKEMRRCIPSTYVPGRNTLFIAFAVSCAEAEGAGTVFIGANSLDYSGYPDCRPEYIDGYNRLIALGTKGGKISVKAPLIKMTKAGIIRLGLSLGVPYEYTWSCYSGGRKPCGVCDSCRLRAKGFAEAGKHDPAL